MSNEDQQPADHLESADEFDQAERMDAERASDAPVGAASDAAASGAQNADGGASTVADESIVAAKIGELEELANERTADLQRLQAEYANYKKRVDRDRALSRQGGVEAVVLDLLPVLDSIEAAREHDELTGGFKLVADELERLTGKYGLAVYGEVGDAFDPQRARGADARPDAGCRGDHRVRGDAEGRPAQRPGAASGPGRGGRDPNENSRRSSPPRPGPTSHERRRR